jgi:hypothetical protein
MPGFTIPPIDSTTFPGSYSKNGDVIMGTYNVNSADAYPLAFGSAAFLNTSITPVFGTCSGVQSLSAAFTGSSHTSTTIDGIENTGTAYFGGPLQVGQQILGPGAPVGCTIASIASSTSITLSAATSSSLTGATFNALSPWLTLQSFIGVAAREVKAAGLYSSSSFVAYLQASVADVLQRGSCVVQTTQVQTVTPWGLVYLRIGVGGNYPYLPVGTWESISDPGFNICLTNMRYTNASVSSDGVTEVAILSRNTA